MKTRRNTASARCEHLQGSGVHVCRTTLSKSFSSDCIGSQIWSGNPEVGRAYRSLHLLSLLNIICIKPRPRLRRNPYCLDSAWLLHLKVDTRTPKSMQNNGLLCYFSKFSAMILPAFGSQVVTPPSPWKAGCSSGCT